MKLFKVISSSGELSRRKSIDAIQEAMVTVNGKLILDPFIDVEAKDDIRLDDKKINYNTDLTTILLNKPKGYISTKSDEKGRKTIFELIPKIPKFLKRIGETVHDIFLKKPCAVITIDSKGFNFRIAKQIALKQNNETKKIKLIHMVAPTVWAWRPGRAKKIAKLFDHLLAMFPFEPAYFIPHGLKTSFVGHPACLLYTSPSPRDQRGSRMPGSA